MPQSFLPIGVGSVQRTTAGPCRDIEHPGNRRIDRSGGQPPVAMMKTSNLWKGNNFACFGGLDWPWHWTVLAQRKVRARLVIVFQIGSENAPQVQFTQNDVVIKALSPDRSDHPFSVGVLPG